MKDAAQHSETFLKTLENSSNKELLECIAKGARHVLEGTNYGNIYATQIGMHSTPAGDVVGSGAPGPADMITEDSEVDGDVPETSEEESSDVSDVAEDPEEDIK